jgi:hypothetical protein
VQIVAVDAHVQEIVEKGIKIVIEEETVVIADPKARNVSKESTIVTVEKEKKNKKVINKRIIIKNIKRTDQDQEKEKIVTDIETSSEHSLNFTRYHFDDLMILYFM